MSHKQYHLSGLEVEKFWVVIAKDTDTGWINEHGPFYTKVTPKDSGIVKQYEGSEANYRFTVEERFYIPDNAITDWLSYKLSTATIGTQIQVY